MKRVPRVHRLERELEPRLSCRPRYDEREEYREPPMSSVFGPFRVPSRCSSKVCRAKREETREDGPLEVDRFIRMTSAGITMATSPR